MEQFAICQEEIRDEAALPHIAIAGEFQRWMETGQELK